MSTKSGMPVVSTCEFFFVYYVASIDLDDVVGYGFVYYVVNIDLDDVVGYGFVYYVVSIDLDDVVGYGFVYYVVNIDLDDVRLIENCRKEKSAVKSYLVTVFSEIFKPGFLLSKG